MAENFDPETVKVHGAKAVAYYNALNAKHFYTKSGVGSVFADLRVGNLDDLLVLAHYQRGNLDGDDRDQYVDVEPHCFKDGSYYIRVKVEGEDGATRAGNLPDDTVVKIRRTKPGVPPDLVTAGRRRPVEHGTIIMVDEKVDGEPTGRRVVITAFPGSPAAPVGVWREHYPDGTVFLAGDLNGDETVLFDGGGYDRSVGVGPEDLETEVDLRRKRTTRAVSPADDTPLKIEKQPFQIKRRAHDRYTSR